MILCVPLIVCLQMMKALLECVISKNTEVHQASLLMVRQALPHMLLLVNRVSLVYSLCVYIYRHPNVCVYIFLTYLYVRLRAQAIRACYNIHLVSRNQVNKTTARATLTQVRPNA